METCVVLSQHPRNHHHHHHHSPHGRSGRSGGGLYFSPPPSRAFRGINCRAFQSDVGILPPPLSTFPSSASSSSTSPSLSPRSRSDLPSPRSEPARKQQQSRRSNPIPITTKRTTSLPSQSQMSADGSSFLADDINNSSDSSSNNSSYTELWAGPAYSNSPPPSSLPIPKFSLRGKRSASLDLPQQMKREELRPLPKSAPASPSRESAASPPSNRFFSDAFATWDLCRMLNLSLDEDED